jgi:hypothetical protein
MGKVNAKPADRGEKWSNQISIIESHQRDDENSNSPVTNLIKIMASVILDSPEADLNQTTISDEKGGRIYL